MYSLSRSGGSVRWKVSEVTCMSRQICRKKVVMRERDCCERVSDLQLVAAGTERHTHMNTKSTETHAYKHQEYRDTRIDTKSTETHA